MSSTPVPAADRHSGYLTPEQLEFYRVEGYLVVEHLFDAADLAPVQRAFEDKVDAIVEQMMAEGVLRHRYADAPFPRRLALVAAEVGEQQFLRFGRSWRDRHPGFFHLMSHPRLLDAIESLIGPEIFANPVYNVRPKVPGVAAGAIPWHQDKSYWPDANSNPVITAWMPLVPTNRENGCLRIWPRTQHQKVLSHHKETYTGTGYTEIDEIHLQGMRYVELPVNPGTVIFFKDRCIHGSGPNCSEEVRWSLDLRYQPTDQDPMPQYGAGFLARSRLHPERVATLEDWLAQRPERAAA